MKKTYFAGGCYWCNEAIFRKVKGIHDVISGFATPISDDGIEDSLVETVQVINDENTIDFTTLVQIFFSVHDPTTSNRQGDDIGPEYRSISFF